MIDDAALTESKDMERYEKELEADERKQRVVGFGVIALFLVAFAGFVGGAMFVSHTIGLQVKASTGDQSETVPSWQGERK